MSVEARELMSDGWTRLQGHLVNGVFPLGPYLGCSDRSAVFLTKSETRWPGEVAIKLVPATRALAESLLPRWKRAGALTQPHVLRLLEWGGCQLDGLPHLYAVMEYADQTLAQLLRQRALTDDEAREMLPPILEALAFLHGRNLLQGQLKPANILVVRDQLKLASDTIRRLGEGTTTTPSAYDPPEAVHGNTAPAGDIWALGVCLFEALTRRAPSSCGERADTFVLPAEFSPAFRDVVARCLSPRPQDRPSLTELLAWSQGQSAWSAPAASIQSAALVYPEPAPAASPPTAPAPPRVAPQAAQAGPSMAQSPRPRGSFAVMLAASVILALGWAGVRVFRNDRTAVVPAPAVQASGASLSQAPGGAAHPEVRPGVSAVSTMEPRRSDVATAPSALHEVIPEVPRRARRTIHGHIEVWVRVIVDPDGSVLAAVADRLGPSRYFRRLAVEAAKDWKFPPVATPSRRLMQVRFDFTRDGTTARALTPH